MPLARELLEKCLRQIADEQGILIKRVDVQWTYATSLVEDYGIINSIEIEAVVIRQKNKP